ncbi:hypothetical protein EJB05_10456 [Eragrostis curvula]|uniref:non-specific serine/threonine protein kinase n=1 Tax=Eragrostis curvula TaxID=38414 RepID=A0A5J9VNT1_9POAL|nr:hypothetical protein EJB05_10456 [Eragrostis curvula]
MLAISFYRRQLAVKQCPSSYDSSFHGECSCICDSRRVHDTTGNSSNEEPVICKFSVVLISSLCCTEHEQGEVRVAMPSGGKGTFLHRPAWLYPLYSSTLHRSLELVVDYFEASIRKEGRREQSSDPMGNCCTGSAKCANASTPFESKVTIRSSTSTASNSIMSGHHLPSAADEMSFSGGGGLKSFSMNELRAATKNFGSNSYLGEGGFGCVYKGWMDSATLAPTKPGVGRMVAIKKLKKESFQGHKEWLAEVTYLGQLHHANLVKLVGYCSDSDSNKLLVYEYMLRGSLENHLFRRATQPLPWHTRVGVAVDVARGMAFLHAQDVIFRDLKSSNVLLDADYRAKLSDFGLARNGPTGDKSHVSTRVVGTRGYAAPEYIATGHLSIKSDIYSFGVVLLELLTGRRALDEERGSTAVTLVDWARPQLGERRKVIRIMDTRLGGQYPKKQAQEVAALALQCLQNDPKNRPAMADGILPQLEQLMQNKSSSSSSCRPRRRRTDQAATPRASSCMQCVSSGTE